MPQASAQGFMLREGVPLAQPTLKAPVTAKKDSKSTLNLISLFGLNIYLPVKLNAGITYTTELICYSNGINQNFDCTVDYTIFIETATT